MFALALAFLPISTVPCTATDGDTLRCGRERVRLIGIDAPELANHCAPRRRCASGDPVAARASLARLLTLGPVTLTRYGTDRYGRTLALADVATPRGRIDLSCHQLTSGHAVARLDWPQGWRLTTVCPQARTTPTR